MHRIHRTAVFIGVAAIALAMTTSTPATAAALHAGDLDPTFGTAGIVTTDFGRLDVARATAIQPDGKIVAAGDNDGSFTVARYNPNGSPDQTFGSAGQVTTRIGGLRMSGSAVGIQPDGKIIVAGGESPYFVLVRYNNDGTSDTSFGIAGDGIVTIVVDAGSAAHAMAIQPDGKIIVAGSARLGIGHTDRFALARFTVDGRLDLSFAAGGTLTTAFPGFDTANAWAVAVQPDAKIVAAGVAAGPGGSVAVARYNSDGSLDRSFGTAGTTTTGVGTSAEGFAVALQPGGKIVVAGVTIDDAAPRSVRWLLVRYDVDGNLDPSFASGGVVITQIGTSDSQAFGVAIQRDGKIVAAGEAFNATFDQSVALARYDRNGSLDTTFGIDGTALPDIGSASDARAVALPADGRIVAVGEVVGASSGDFGVFRLLSDTPPTVSAGGPYSGTEGSAVGLSGAVTDPTVSHSWTVVAQTGVDAGAACAVADPASLSTTVSCTDDGVYTVTLTAGGVSDTTTVTVDNVAPAVTITSPADGTPVKTGASVTMTAHFADPGINDTHTCAADFGAGTVNEAAGTCTLTHAFSTGAHDVTVKVTDDDGGVGSASAHLVAAAVNGEAFGLRATGPVKVPATPLVTCPPNQSKTTVSIRTPIASISGLSASCQVDPATGNTTASASAGTITALGLIHISGIDSTCTSTIAGLSGTSHVGSINGRPIGSGHGSIGIPDVAQVFFNETVTGNGQLTQNAIRIHTVLGEDITLASCHLG